MGFVARVRRTLEQRRLLSRGHRVVVACSGGPDSSALLQALAELRSAYALELWAASVDHGLRREAREEMALVEAHALALGVPFRALQVSVASHHGKQAGARAARYEALLGLCAALGADHLATGHTRDDQAETVLSRLLRSPSVRALGAIRAAREDGVVRPLLDCSRAEVTRFVGLRGLRVAHDPSNRDPAYTRSRVRHELLPGLLRENPRLVEALAFLAEDAQEHQALLEASTPRLDLEQPGARDVLGEQPAPARRWLLGTWIAEHTGTPASLEQLRALAGPRTPDGVLLARGLVARWRRDGSLALDSDTKRRRGG